MEETKDDICEKLDKVLLDFFETLTQLYQKQALLDQSMKSGFLNLSRARYNMGIKAVGIAQCDANNMSALLKVQVTKDNTFTESNHDLETELNDLDLKKSDESSKSTVRRRNVKKSAEDVEPEHIEDIPQINEDVKSEDNGNSDKKKPVDPLKWFGVLVPQSLRQSQGDFKAAANMALDIATLKTKLDNVGQEYRNLLKTKETLVD